MSRPREAGYANGARLGANFDARHDIIRNTVVPYAEKLCSIRDSAFKWSNALEREYYREYYASFIEGWWEATG